MFSPSLQTCRECGANCWRISPVDARLDVCGACWAERAAELAGIEPGNRYVRTNPRARTRWRQARRGETGVSGVEVWRAWVRTLPARPGLGLA